MLAIALLLWSVAPADAALVQWHVEGPADGFWPPVAAGGPVLLDRAFDTNLVALRLFWLGQAVQIDPSAPGLPHGVAPFCDWPNCDSYLLLPPASVLGGMPPAGGSLVPDVPYPAKLYLESYGASTHIEGEVVATPEPTSLLLLGTGVLGGDGLGAEADNEID